MSSGAEARFRLRSLQAALSSGRLPVDPHASEAPIDDDLAQAILLAETLVGSPILDVDRFAARLVEWRATSGHGIGILTETVLASVEAGTPTIDAARIAWEATGRTSAGNGAVMRCAPVAIRWPYDRAQRVHDAEASCVVTHFDPRCIWTTVATVEVIAMLLRGEEPDIVQLVRQLEADGAPTPVVEAAHLAINASIHDWVLDGPNQGFTLLCMQVALWAAQQPPDFERVITAVVSAGGDADTNGAVAGAVMGARVGEAGIPVAWLEAIPERDRLMALADQLVEQGPKAERPEQP